MPRKEEPRPPDDELTRQLRASIRRRRPWTIPSILVTLFILLVPIALLLWWSYPTPEPPHLEIVALDQLAIPEAPVTLLARLDPFPPPEEPLNLAGYRVFFEERQKRTETSTDRSGEARLQDTFAEPKTEYLVLFPGDKKRRSVRDRAHVFLHRPETPLLLVDVLHCLSPESAQGWQAKNILDIAPRPEASKALQSLKKKFQIIYVATQPDSALAYRRARGWVENRVLAKDAFPEGPVLGRSSYLQPDGAARQEILRSLKERGTNQMTAVVGDAESAAVCRALAVETILLGEGEVPAEVTRVTSWPEITQKLQ